MNKTPDTNKTSCQHPDAALTTVIYFVDEDRLLSLTHEHPKGRDHLSVHSRKPSPHGEPARGGIQTRRRRGGGGQPS